MSVALLITPLNKNEEDTYVPIATEADFIGYWEPLLKQGNYPWLRQLTIGIPIEADDTPYIIAELDRLIAQVNLACGNPQLSRMQRARDVLAAINWHQTKNVFFG